MIRDVKEVAMVMWLLKDALRAEHQENLQKIPKKLAAVERKASEVSEEAENDASLGRFGLRTRKSFGLLERRVLSVATVEFAGGPRAP